MTPSLPAGAAEPGAPAESPGPAGAVPGPGPLGGEPGACLLWAQSEVTSLWLRVTWAWPVAVRPWEGEVGLLPPCRVWSRPPVPPAVIGCHLQHGECARVWLQERLSPPTPPSHGRFPGALIPASLSALSLSPLPCGGGGRPVRTGKTGKHGTREQSVFPADQEESCGERSRGLPVRRSAGPRLLLFANDRRVTVCNVTAPGTRAAEGSGPQAARVRRAAGLCPGGCWPR